MKKYQVIGGQYHFVNYGESDSLHGAKCIAARNIEHWDNWQGWHTPSIYLLEDCEEVEGKLFPALHARAVAFKSNVTNTWAFAD